MPFYSQFGLKMKAPFILVVILITLHLINVAEAVGRPRRSNLPARIPAFNVTESGVDCFSADGSLEEAVRQTNNALCDRKNPSKSESLDRIPNTLVACTV